LSNFSKLGDSRSLLLKRVLQDRQTTQKRKKEHLDLALNGDMSSRSLTSGFERYSFVHQALPEMNLGSVDARISLFGRSLRSPIVISSMVGGIDEALDLNRNLAAAAEELGIAMGVGSQRCGLDDPDAINSYLVRDVAPNILLFANLGAVQLNYGYSVDHCRRAVDMIGADVLVLHLNPLQEALQPEGNTDFEGLLGKIEIVCRELEVPVVLKEVGFGISGDVAARLLDAGVSGIDVAGAGGTSFSCIELSRAAGSDDNNAFSEWGITTAESLKMVRLAAPNLPVIASGGIRTGVEVAKAIALGADAAGIGAPLLKSAASSASDVVRQLDSIVKDLRIAMFCTGCSTIDRLKNTNLLVQRN
jgi:isopentenyl-diphosphate delta-isomerase